MRKESGASLPHGGSSYDEAGDQRFRELAERIPQLVWSTTPDGTVDYFNSRWCEYTGGTLSCELWLDLLHPEDRGAVLSAWQTSLKTGCPYKVEYRLRRKRDGVYRWMLASAYPVRDSSGGIIRWFGTCTDIDDQKSATEQQIFLSEATKRLFSSLDYEETLQEVIRTALPRLADWVIIDLIQDKATIKRIVVTTDDSKKEQAKRLEDFAPTAERSYGVRVIVERGEIFQLHEVTDEILLSGIPDSEHAKLAVDLGVRSFLSIPLKARGKILGALSLIMGSSGRKFSNQDMWLAQELARRAAIAADNARLYQEVQDALNSRDEFFSIASHELRTPITSIKLQLQLLERLGRFAKGKVLPVEQYEDKIKSCCEQMNRLVTLAENLLDVSRLKNRRLSIEFTPVNLTSVVRSTITQLSEEASLNGCGVQAELRDDIMCLGDRIRLGQVVTNLLTNAFKFGRGHPVEVKLDQDHKSVKLLIKDFGIGIQKDSFDRIFSRFERSVAARDYCGLGLGLYITKQILEAHNGRIWVESEPGQGSSFFAELPAYPL